MSIQADTSIRQQGHSKGKRSAIAKKALLATGVASVLLGLFGKGKAHAIVGIAFALLAADHVWQRRKAL